MEVNDLPFAIAAVPDTGLLGLGRARDAAGVHVLRDADVGDAGGLVAHQVDVRVQDGGVHRLAVPGPHWSGGRAGGITQRRGGWRLFRHDGGICSALRKPPRLIGRADASLEGEQASCWHRGAFGYFCRMQAVPLENSQQPTSN